MAATETPAIASGQSVRDDGLWRRVDELIDRAPDLAGVREHRLGLLAARRWRALGRLVPRDVVEEERAAAARTMTVPILLRTIRKTAGGPIVLFKGPEVATRYPESTLRPYGDLDLLVPDPVAVHRRLLRAGFKEVGDPDRFVDIHHLRPLQLEPLPLLVEVHSAPKWIDGRGPAAARALLGAAVPSSLEIDGILTLRPDHHAVVLAVHSWAHEPLGRLLDLIDIAAMTRDVDHDAARAFAAEWGVDRLWRTMLAATDAVLGERAQPAPLPLRLWARSVGTVRRRTVLESHLERWLADFWALPPRAALRAAAVAAARALVRAPGETWRDKLRRVALAVKNASMARSDHDRALAGRKR